MEANYISCLPEPLLDKILISAGIGEWYLRPLSLISKDFLSASNRLKRSLHISTRNAHCLPRLLQRFPNIKHINLPFFIDPEKFFAELSRFGICLESLDMSLMSSFRRERFKELPLSSLRSSLKSLKLTYVEDQNDADGDLDIISEVLSNLEELELSWGYQVTDDGFEKLTYKLWKLRRISLAGSSLITDKSMTSMVGNCLDLEEIALSDCQSISSQGIVFLLDNIKLKSVVLQGMDDIGNDRLFTFSCNLSTIELSSMVVSDGLLDSISDANFPLKRFSLSDCRDFTLDGILRLLNNYNSLLEYYAIEDSTSENVTRMDGMDPVHLSSFLSNVMTVKLNYWCQLSTTQLLALIHNCSKVNTLELKGAQTCLDQVAPVIHHDTKSQIRSLNLSFSKMLTDVCLEQLAPACPHLEQLFVNGCKEISHRGINQMIRNCPSLRIVHLNGCERVSRLSFKIGFAKLEVLEARGSGLDDESLILIASKCPELICLDMSNCWNVTALGFRQVVMKCRNLWKLGISFKHYVGSDLEYWIKSMKPWMVYC